jgi:hypothetical protein
MSEFQFDTSGKAYRSISETTLEAVYWSDLSPFVQGYVEAMMQAANEVVWPGIPQFRNAMGGALDLKFSDLAPENLARIMEDCERFAKEFGEWPGKEHGYGWWIGRQRGSYSPQFPPLTVYLGDDGKVYLRDAR